MEVHILVKGKENWQVIFNKSEDKRIHVQINTIITLDFNDKNLNKNVSTK